MARVKPEPDGRVHPDSSEYVCPHCRVYSQMYQRFLHWRASNGTFIEMDSVRAQTCASCTEVILWHEDSAGYMMVFPLDMVGPPPIEDMPEDVMAIYDEARAVSSRSPKSAAALLRLALQVLVDSLEPGAGSINEKIGKLVVKGLEPRVQQAMDILRVVGNNAVHPGEIELDARPEIVNSLFKLLNLVVEQMITRPREVDALYLDLPQGTQDAIKRRDTPKM